MAKKKRKQKTKTNKQTIDYRVNRKTNKLIFWENPMNYVYRVWLAAVWFVGGGKEKSEGHPSEPSEDSSNSEANESGW